MPTKRLISRLKAQNNLGTSRRNLKRASQDGTQSAVRLGAKFYRSLLIPEFTSTVRAVKLVLNISIITVARHHLMPDSAHIRAAY
jgi:hypothetical protein